MEACFEKTFMRKESIQFMFFESSLIFNEFNYGDVSILSRLRFNLTSVESLAVWPYYEHIMTKMNSPATTRT